MKKNCSFVQESYWQLKTVYMSDERTLREALFTQLQQLQLIFKVLLRLLGNNAGIKQFPKE